MDLPQTVLIILGAATAAILTGLFNLTNLIISKENKVSDFRQKWLDEFREEMGKLLGGVETLLRLVEHMVQPCSKGLSDEKLTEFRSKHEGRYLELNEMRYRVLLRLNPKEHVGLQTNLNKLIDAFYGPCDNLEEIRKFQDAVVAEMQRILKDTWEYVKKGEKTFQLLRKILSFILIFLAIVVVLSGISLVYSHIQPQSTDCGRLKTCTKFQPTTILPP
jgi:hypothetical protein